MFIDHTHSVTKVPIYNILPENKILIKICSNYKLVHYDFPIFGLTNGIVKKLISYIVVFVLEIIEVCGLTDMFNVYENFSYL